MTRTGRSRLEHRHGWQGVGMARSDELAENPEVLSFSLSMKGTLTLDVSSASSTMDGDRRGEQWNMCERAKKLPH